MPARGAPQSAPDMPIKSPTDSGSVRLPIEHMFVYRKDAERRAAKRLRQTGRSLREIADELGVALSSVSVWVRDVPLPEAEDAAPSLLEAISPRTDEEVRNCGRCRKTLPESAFSRHPTKRRQWWCKECFREYFRLRGDLHRRQSRAAQRRRQARAREFVADYLAAHPCADCGEADSVLLEFDHVGPKLAMVSALAHDGASVARIKREIEACEVVCANCHRRRTALRAGWIRAQPKWWGAKPPRSRAYARNLAYVLSLLERSECVDCGLGDICVLEFDHVAGKIAPVMAMARDEVSLERLISEIGKCEIRCANCHRWRTFEKRREKLRG